MSLARACLADAEGRHQAAVAALTGSFEESEPTRLLTLPPSHWPSIVRIALRGAEQSVAQAVSGALGTLTARDDSQRIGAAVRAHVDGLLNSDPRALMSAVAGYRSTGRRSALAAACEDLGELMGASAETAQPIAYFEEAGELVSASGARGDGERLRRRLRQLGVRAGAPRLDTVGSPGWRSLTESERKLIPLVVAGLTNRAIADRLHVSVHTVNTHMRHIFTKLDINTRVELTRLAVERGDVADGTG